MSIAQSTAVLAIDGYRRFVSPYKGFSCAHHRLYGQGSCSDFGREAFSRLAFRSAVPLLSARLRECRAAAAALQAVAAAPGLDEGKGEGARRKHGSAWDCVPSCDCAPPADAIDVCSLGDACSCAP